jgi:hypothetical protein
MCIMYPSTQFISSIKHTIYPPHFYTPHLFLGSILNSSQKRLGVCAYDLSTLLAVLEDEEGGHGADAKLLGYIGDFIDVDLDEVCAGEIIGEPISNLLVFIHIIGGRRRDWDWTYLTT